MRFNLGAALAAASLGLALAGPAAAQDKPSIAIMPTQYFSADAESAQNVTQGLAAQWERQGYTVLGMDRSMSTFTSMNLNPSQHYADRVAVRFGRSIGADLVAYPRLLAVGMPLSTVASGSFMAPEAILHLRVLNVRTGAPIYFRQIGHEFRTDAPLTADARFTLPEPVATATAQEASGQYFERVAGSRQEYGRRR